jgi:hypothetical protein
MVLEEHLIQDCLRQARQAMGAEEFVGWVRRLRLPDGTPGALGLARKGSSDDLFKIAR